MAPGLAFRAVPPALAIGALLIAAAPVRPAQAQVLPWEMTVAQIESGRIRSLAQRLSKQNLLFQLRLGDVGKADLARTAGEIDRIIESLEEGRPQRSVPAPWTPQLAAQVAEVDRAWGPLRAIAVADPNQHLRVARQFASAESASADPLLVRRFDELSAELVRASEALLGHYNVHCRETGLAVCEVSTLVGYSEMLLERAAKEAIYVDAGIDVERNRRRLATTVAAYQQLVDQGVDNPLLTSALDPARGPSAQALAELVQGLNGDWQTMSGVLGRLGGEGEFPLAELLAVQDRLVRKIERVTGALLRYATLTYGA